MIISETLAWYIYAVTSGTPDLTGLEGILPGTSVEVVRLGSLNVLASMVPRAFFDSADPTHRTADLAWMTERLAAHHAVNVAAANAAAILPLSFGTVFSSLSLVENWLSPRRDGLLEVLGHLMGRAEWLVCLTENSERHTAWLNANDPALVELRSQAASAGEGLSFLLARRSERTRAIARTEYRKSAVEHISRLLTGISADVIREQDRPDASAWIMLIGQVNGHLVTSHPKLAEYQTELDQAGLSLRITGPWPAYSHAAQALSRELING